MSPASTSVVFTQSATILLLIIAPKYANWNPNDPTFPDLNITLHYLTPPQITSVGTVGRYKNRKCLYTQSIERGQTYVQF